MAIPHLVAHRGYMAQYPENTLVGLEAALQCGAGYIEFDVQSTADGKLVVIHDTRLERTTGVSGDIFEMTYTELKNVRAHEPDRFSLAFFNQRIPLLTDVVRLLQHYPKAMAFVEIKPETLQRFSRENVLTELMRELDIVHKQCVIISYDYEALAYIKAQSDYLTGWVLEDYTDDNLQKARALKPDYLIINHRKIPAHDGLWTGDWHWMLYDITDPELALHYSSFNIPLIETRDICSMLEHPLLALNACDHGL